MNPETGEQTSRVPDMQVQGISEPRVAGGPQTAPAPVKVSVITKDELNQKMKAGESIQIVNVLDPEKYALGLIRGSRKIPLDKLDARSSELDKSKPVVTYCAGVECNASKSAAEKLTAKGFNARAYEGGIKEWKEAGLPTE